MKSKIIAGIILLVIFGSVCILNADLITVDANGGAQFFTIQEAIDFASNGDTILVHPSTYYENINFNGKNIVVASLFLTTGNKDYINDTVINGNHNGVVVTFQNGETSSTILKGFTITNGYAEDGGGIKCFNASKPVIDHLIISDNTATDDGGGVACYYYSCPKISNCLLIDNIAYDNAGGIYMNNCHGLIENCLFVDNTSNAGSSALDLWGSSPLIRNITCYDNYSGGWATIGMWNDANPVIQNSIVFQNTGYGFVFHPDADPIIEFCDCFGNSDGHFSGSVPQGLGTIVQVNANNDPCDEFYNIFIDPLLIDPLNLNLSLSQISPCIDAGIPDTTGLHFPQYDIEGNPRIVDGNGNGVAIIDMGCYEYYNFQQSIYLSIPTENALPGDTVLVPINVLFPQDSTFTSAEIIIGGYLGSLEFLELIADSSLVGNAGWMYEYNETDSLNTIWMAGSEPISGEDVLIWIKFSVPNTATDFIPITLEDALFDTGLVPVELTSGGIDIVALIYGDVDFNGSVQAYDASMILQYLVGYINLDDLQLFVADVSLDSTVSALDATLILQYGVGIIDTLPYQPGASYIANGDITMEDRVYTGDPIDVPIIITNAENIFSFDGLINFDTECLMLSDVYWSDFLDGYFIWTNVESGEFRLVGSGTIPYEEDGIIATIRFYPKDGFNNYDSTTVCFENLRWNENDTMHNIAASIITNNFGTNNPQELEFILHQNSPNPFTYNTKIKYSIPLESTVSLKIYNIRGELIAELVNEFKDKGSYDVVWDGRDKFGNKAVNGIYFYKFISGSSEIIKRMILLR